MTSLVLNNWALNYSVEKGALSRAMYFVSEFGQVAHLNIKYLTKYEAVLTYHLGALIARGTLCHLSIHLLIFSHISSADILETCQGCSLWGLVVP